MTDESATPTIAEIAREVYERCLSGEFYSDHDGDLALLGRLRVALEPVTPARETPPDDGGAR